MTETRVKKKLNRVCYRFLGKNPEKIENIGSTDIHTLAEKIADKEKDFKSYQKFLLRLYVMSSQMHHSTKKSIWEEYIQPILSNTSDDYVLQCQYFYVHYFLIAVQLLKSIQCLDFIETIDINPCLQSLIQGGEGPFVGFLKRLTIQSTFQIQYTFQTYSNLILKSF